MRILILSTWFPYPLSQGSKIRAYHLIKALAERHEVALVTFAEEGLQPGWLEHMQTICSRVQVVKASPFAGGQNRVKSLLGLFSPVPSALYAGYSKAMEALVFQTVADWQPDLIFPLTIIMAQYAVKLKHVRKMVDIDNVLTRYLREAYERSSGLSKRLRAWMAWRKFLAYEKLIFPQFDLCLAVSEGDRNLVHGMFDIPLGRLEVIPNGVTPPNQPSDTEPIPGSLIFNGALTYEANLDAMRYFVTEIFPLIRRRVPAACLKITGRFAGVPVDWIPQDGSVQLTGFLEDVRPAVANSWACVVPLRLGAGTRVKILEAMSLGTPVVTTSKGAEGLAVESGVDLLVADAPEAFAEATVRLLEDRLLRQKLAQAARERVHLHYDWAAIGCKLRDDLVTHALDPVESLLNQPE